MIRLYIEKPLQNQAEIALLPDQSHYLANVMRTSAGDEVLLFNGRDGEWRAIIKSQKKSGAILEATEQTRAQTKDFPLRLLFAPIKRGHGDLVIEKATELGATRLTPVLTQHTVVNRVPTERYTSIATEAAEQCERLSVPQIDEALKLQEILHGWDAGEKLLLCAEAGAATPIAQALNTLPDEAFSLMTGPEGGFSEGEFSLLRQQKYVIPVSLGPRILRADTAAIAALSILQAVKGDWREARD